ncbi:MAG TPA: gluconokinase [Mycobacteriales bacterium]|nr:gluconokinase [Mycobacteriales bacterium]
MVIVMGVSGSGKTTVGAPMAEQLGWDFAEGDSFHPPENVAKMSSGTPLTDADRWPWLAKLAEWIDEHLAAGESGVVTCSALKRSYRDVLRKGHESEVFFLHLHGTREQLQERLEGRRGHFMPPGLLSSQLADLEPLGPDERGMTLDVGGPVTETVRLAIERATA